MSSEPSCTADSNVRFCLSRGQNIGIAFDGQSGLISLLAIATVFILIIRNVIVYNKGTSHRWRVVQVPADAYMLCLFSFDLVHAVGGVLNLKWAHDGLVEIGPYCTAQGITQQLGETGVALTTLAIAIHTFVTILSSRGVRNFVIPYIVIATIWIFVILFVAIGTGVIGADKYITPTPYWCWLNRHYSKERLAGEYIWLWTALFGSAALYIPLFLWNRGNITVDRVHWWKAKFHWRARAASAITADERQRPGASSLAILAYPIVYTIIVLPLSVIRWIEFHQEAVNNGVDSVPSAATLSAEYIFRLSGAVNVLLLLTTRPELLLFGRRRQQTRRPTVEARIAPPSPQPKATLARDYDEVEMVGPQRQPSFPQLRRPPPSVTRATPALAVHDGRLRPSDSDWDLPIRDEDGL